MSKNKPTITTGLLLAEYWVLRNDINFMGNNTIYPSTHRNDSNKNSDYYIYHFRIALHKHHHNNQIHSKIN
jgi:hypothetical protein